MTSITTSAHPNNFTQLKCSPSTLICREKTVILGRVTIGADCVIQPTVSIIAKAGPIVIGNNNLFEERVLIVNNTPETLTIGDHNVFEVDSQCYCPRVGSHNVLESKSIVGSNVELTDNCIIGAGCVLQEDESDKGEGEQDKQVIKLEPSTVFWGRNQSKRVVQDLPISSHSSQLDFLRKILPNYQKLWRPLNVGTPQLQKQDKS